MKAKAFESGLQFAKETGLQEFILEGDSLNVVRALQGLPLLLVLVMPIIYRIQSSTHDDVKKMLFHHVCKNGNKSTYLLAKHAFCIIDFVI